MHKIAFILLLIGGVNWGIAAFNGMGLEGLFLGGSIIWTIIYALVGISALYELFTHKKNCSQCMGGGSSQAGGSDMGM